VLGSVTISFAYFIFYDLIPLLQQSFSFQPTNPLHQEVKQHEFDYFFFPLLD